MALRLPGAIVALKEFLAPDFSQLTPTSLFAALGQAFFSLSLGGTFYLVYGSYLRDRENIPRTAIATGIGDAGAALLAVLGIFRGLHGFHAGNDTFIQGQPGQRRFAGCRRVAYCRRGPVGRTSRHRQGHRARQ